MFSIAKIAKNRNNFECKTCDYSTCNKYDYEKHIKTIKHKTNESAIKPCDLAMNLEKKSQDDKFICNNCDKSYKDYSGLWRHKKKCKNIINENLINEDIINEENSNLDLTDSNVIFQLIKQNDEFKQMIVEQNKTIIDQSNKLFEICKNGTNNTLINNNSNNKTFNLNVFLNEHCKDAMNITDFVDSLQLQLSDLENVGKLGYIEGISNIIIKNLKALDVHKRPVHCTDKKREVLYVKDEDKWEKEDEEKKKIHKVIKKVALKNQRMIPKFKEEHPDCGKSASKFSDQYNKIILEAMGGLGDNDKEKEERIIKNISKYVTLDKDIN
jgi:hypothetical protein